VIVMGNLRANEITNDVPELMVGIRQQVQIAMADAASCEQALNEAVLALRQGRGPKLIVVDGGANKGKTS